MGKKNRHSKDRLYMSAAETAAQGGRQSGAGASRDRTLPFECCALSLSPFETPCCGVEGVIFDLVNIVPYLQKHKKNPISGEVMASKDLIRLNMSKNADGAWMCPVTCKSFNDSSHVVAIRTTGNVFAYEAVQELNIKNKNFEDLLTGEKFTKADIITLQDPHNATHCAKRDISNFVHLQQVREDAAAARNAEGHVRHNPTSESVFKEIERKRAADEAAGIKRKTLEEMMTGGFSDEGANDDVEALLALRASTQEVSPGQVNTDGRAGSSLTSSSAGVHTSSAVRLARPEELRVARYAKMKTLGKKGYVQLQTNFGNLNIELHCDMAPRTCWNFITLCARGYYDNTIFHRLIRGFMLQGKHTRATSFAYLTSHAFTS